MKCMENKVWFAFVLTLVLCMSVCFGAQAATVASGTCGDNVTWVLDDEGTLTISGSGAMDSISGFASAPWYDDRESVKSIVVQSGVTSVSRYAFYNCINATSAVVPNTVTSIGSSAFYNCRSLVSMSLPFSGGSAYSNTFLGYIFGATRHGDNPRYVPNTLTHLTLTKGVSIAA